MKRLEFEQIGYDPSEVYFPVSGNDIGKMQRIYSKKSQKAIEAEQPDIEKAKQIYENDLIKGKTFRYVIKGTDLLGSVLAKITNINFDSKTMNWKQVNLSEMMGTSELLKPASSRWTIDGFIHSVKDGLIKIVDE